MNLTIDASIDTISQQLPRAPRHIYKRTDSKPCLGRQNMYRAKTRADLANFEAEASGPLRSKDQVPSHANLKNESYKQVSTTLDIKNDVLVGIRVKESNLISVIVPRGVKKIACRRTGVFSDCCNLTCLTLPDTLTDIGDGAFQYCDGITTLKLPEALTNIGARSFFECAGLSSLTLPNALTSIGHDAFGNCKGLTSVALPDTLTHLGNAAFQYCNSIKSLRLSHSLTIIPDAAFCGCDGLTSVTLPEGLTSIDRAAFQFCSGLTSLTLPNTLTCVGECAFQLCKGLTSLTLPHGLTRIGNDAFRDCTKLTSVVFRPPVSRAAFIAWAVGTVRMDISAVADDGSSITKTFDLDPMLGLITQFALCPQRDVSSLDPRAFMGCTQLPPWPAHNCGHGEAMDYSWADTTPHMEWR